MLSSFHYEFMNGIFTYLYDYDFHRAVNMNVICFNVTKIRPHRQNY